MPPGGMLGRGVRADQHGGETRKTWKFTRGRQNTKTTRKKERENTNRKLGIQTERKRTQIEGTKEGKAKAKARVKASINNKQIDANKSSRRLWERGRCRCAETHGLLASKQAEPR